MPLLDHFHPPVSERRRWEGFHGLALGQPLPLLSLALRNAATIPVDLEETYSEARERSRLG